MLATGIANSVRLTNSRMTAFAFKSDTLYIACSPELGVFSFGHCQDEALNNLADEIRDRGVGASTGNEKSSHALN
jgi:hypothetical protein